MSANIGYNPMIKCDGCNALIDRNQYHAKNGLCFECRKEQRKQDESVKESEADDE